MQLALFSNYPRWEAVKNYWGEVYHVVWRINDFQDFSPNDSQMVKYEIEQFISDEQKAKAIAERMNGNMERYESDPDPFGE
jgi:hypothetical protein